MSKITIIYEDKAMYVDGEAYSNLDVSSMPSELHALQWFGEFGHIEYFTHADGTTQANEPITELPAWVAPIKAEWDKAKAEKEKADAEFQAAVEAQKILAAEIALEHEKYEKWMAAKAIADEQNRLNPDPHFIPQQ